MRKRLHSGCHTYKVEVTPLLSIGYYDSDRAVVAVGDGQRQAK